MARFPIHLRPTRFVGLHLEELETRRLLAGDLSFRLNPTGKALFITGTERGEEIRVGVSGTGNFEIEHDGLTIDTLLSATGVLLVRVAGLGGNDRIELLPSLGTRNGQLFGGEGDDVLHGGDGNDLVQGDQGQDELYGHLGNDRLMFESDEILFGHAGIDTAIALASANLVVSANADVEYFRGSSGNDIIDASAVASPVQILGLNGDDRLIGGSGNDTLDGGQGNDLIEGNDGEDELIGGIGNDVLNGGNQLDTVNYSLAPAGVTVDLGLASASDGSGGTDTLSNFEKVIGSNQDDFLIGDSGSNLLYGGNGNDRLAGNGGADQYFGQAGSDTIDYSAATNFVAVSLYRRIGYDGFSLGDTYNAVENVIGSPFSDIIGGDGQINRIEGLAGNDQLYGEGNNDLLFGGEHDDQLFGGIGNDTLEGENGDDVLFADSSDVHLGGNGFDRITPDVTSLQATDGVSWILVDSDSINVVTGTNNADTVDCSAITFAMSFALRGGDDFLTAGSNDDVINGGDGNDTLFGGLGRDVIRGDAGNDSLFGNDLANTPDGVRDRFFGGLGIDSAVGRLLDPNAVGGDTIDATLEVDLRV